MAKKKLNAFNDRNAKEITTEDVEGLLKMQKEAKDKANYEANKANYKAPKYNSLPTLDDTSKKVSTKAPSVSPETMNVGNKTFKVADNARKTSIDSGKKLANGKKDEQTEYYNKQIEKRNNLKRSESSLGNYGWEGSLKSIRNKQIAKTDKELSSSYINDVNNEKEVNSAVDKWLNPEYKMTDFERKQAQKLTNDYFKKFNKATGGATKNLKGEEKKRYDRMNELATKSNKASAAVMGSADALGAITLGKGLNKALDKEMAKEVNQRIDKEQEVARRQSPLAYNAGYMGTKMGEYAALNKLLDSVPVLTKFGQTLNSFGGLTKDMFADLLLDTAFETAENAVNGESLGKVSADTAKNIGANIVFNMLPELLGGALKSANPEMADDVVKNLSEALQKEEVKPDTSFVDFANELTNRDINVSPYMDNTQRATIDRLRAENPQLLGRLSDEDVLAFDRANTGADVLNQNYETLRNVMNNTDQPTRAIADNGGDIPSALDIIPNETTGNYKVIQDFRAQNPALTQNMSDRDILNYLNTPKSVPSLENKNLSEVFENDVPKKKNGIQVYRGYNRSDNPLERNLAKEKTLSDVLGKKIPGTEEPEMLPLKYYTESFEDAESYANHDKLFYDSLHESAKREMAGDAINGKIKMNNMSEAAKEAYIKNIMDETYRILTGREPIFGNGHVDTLTINPNNVLDITTLGDRTNTENVYNLLSEMTGLPHTLPNGQYGANLDDYLSLSGLGDEFNTYMLLRNLGKGGNYGKNFTGLMRDYGYDAVKYSEDGYNHYALLDDFDKSKVGTNEQLIARYNERIQKILDDINRRDVKEPYKWEEETLNDLENSIDYLLENEPHIDANTVDTKSVPSLEKPIANEVTEEVSKEVEPTMTAIDYDNAVRDLSERYSIANEVDDLVHDDLAKAITFDSDADKEAFEEVYNAFLEDSKNIMNAKNHGEIVDYIRRIDEESRALDNLMGKGYVLDKGSKKELQRIKKNFYDNTRGTVIRLTPDLRHEMGLDGKTIAELNNELRLGKNGIRFSANNGTPIDMLFDELKQASGNAMRDADNSADQINALMEYVESLKNGEAAKMRVGARDLIDEDLFDVLSENVGAYDDALAKLGVRPEGEGLPIREEVPDNITNIFDEEPAVRYMAEDTGIGSSTIDETDIPERVTDYGSIKTEERLNPEANSGYERPEIDNPNPEFGTSQLYSNTLQKTVDPEEFAKFYDASDYAYEKTKHSQLAENAAKICGENFDNEYNRLLNLESFDAQDVANAAFIRDYLSKNGYEKESSEFMRRIRPVMSTMTAQALEAHKMFVRSTPEGILDEMLIQLDKKVDNNLKGIGYTDTVNRMADKLADAIKDGNYEEAHNILNKKLGDFSLNTKGKVRYGTKEIQGKQEVLDFIENASNNKTPAEIAAEAKKMIQKAQKVSTFDFNDEQKVLGIIKKMFELDPKSREYKQLEAQAASYVQNFMPTSLGNKIKTILYNNMLGNIKTAVSRNFGGNLAFNIIEAVQHPLRTGLDALASKATGVRNYTMSKSGKQWADYMSGFKKGMGDQWEDLKTGLNTTRSGEEGMLEALNNNTKAWKYSDAYDPTTKTWLNDASVTDKGRLASNNISNLVRNVMGLGDRGFYEGAYARAKTELNEIVAKYGEDAIQRVGTTGTEESIGDLIEFWAHYRALEACFQQKSLSAKALTKLKEGMALWSEDILGFDVLSMATGAFTQVPGNMISVGIDYSIPGLIKNAVKTGKELSAGEFNQKRFVDQTSRNLTGLGLTGGGVALARNGWITGPKSEDTDKNKAQTRAGEMEYALRLPNGTQIDLSDVPVVGGKLQAGAAINDAWEKAKNGEMSYADAVLKGVGADAEAMIGTSALQGMNRMFGGNNLYNTNKSMFDNALDTVGSSATQWIPSLLRQTAQTLDPYKRDLGESGTLEYYKNNVLNNLPGLRQTLPIKLDNQAHPYLQNQGRSMGMKALENYILPYTISQPDEVYSDLDKVANDLYDRIGTDANPAYVPPFKKADARELLGDNYNSDTYYDLKKQYGETVDALGSKIINSKDFKSLSDTDKVDVLKNTYTTAKEITKRSYGKEATKNAAADYYENGDINSAVNSLIDKKILSNMSEQYTKKNGEGKSFSDLSKEENLKVLTDMVNDGYMTKEEAYDYLPDNKMVNTLSQYGNKGYELYADLVQYGTSNEGKFTNEKVIPVLRGTNTDPKIAGEVLHAMNSGGNSKRADQVYNELGPEGLWDYYNYKEYANLDGEGNISKDELVAYLNSRDMDRDEKYFWFDMLKSGSNVKNPY